MTQTRPDHDKDASLTPKYTLDELKQFAVQRSWRDDIPIPGTAALRILRDETLAHLAVAMDRIKSLAPLGQVMQYKLAESHKQRDEAHAQRDQEFKVIRLRATEATQQADMGDVASIKRMVEELKKCKGRAFRGIKDIDVVLNKTESELVAVQVCLESVTNLQKTFKPLAFKGIAAYMSAFVTSFLLTLFALVLEFEVAYVVSKWVEPVVNRFVSFEVTVLIIFLTQYFLLNPLLSRIKEYLFWLIYEHRLRALCETLHDLEVSDDAVRSTAVAVAEQG